MEPVASVADHLRAEKQPLDHPLDCKLLADVVLAASK